MSTNDNNAYGDLDKSNLKFIYEQFLRLRAASLPGVRNIRGLRLLLGRGVFLKFFAIWEE